MRLIDADALIEFCAERWIPLNIDAVNMQPTIQPEKAQLSQEGATSDLISRQAAIDAIDCISGVEEVLRSLPTIQPELTDEQVIDYCGKKGYKIVADDLFDLLSKSESPWIPVSERLPEEPGYYITSNEYNGVGEDFYYDGHFCNADKNAYEVLAWMPKPEHYKPNK